MTTINAHIHINILTTLMHNESFAQWDAKLSQIDSCLFFLSVVSKKWSVFVCPIGGTLPPPCCPPVIPRSLMYLSVCPCKLETKTIFGQRPQSVVPSFFSFLLDSLKRFCESDKSSVLCSAQNIITQHCTCQTGGITLVGWQTASGDLKII